MMIFPYTCMRTCSYHFVTPSDVFRIQCTIARGHKLLMILCFVFPYTNTLYVFFNVESLILIKYVVV